ncbi:hypothetical protein SK854_19250 [Lentzea sp. BCCO 10_0061]|uniref:Uncharacterized protein n=1 Tax=Lentzea sokolovensis TaxID=3095429 RepID=A0ABU4UXK8_9PSEU|nr:hypothetical protein [Lentzea sp. BCCO 10_0061]MDX8144262.1 hypothetical protein [Lentzea sp. BCCO 10_0061]
MKLTLGTACLVATLFSAVAAPASAADEPWDAPVSIGEVGPEPADAVHAPTNLGLGADPVACFRGHVQDIGWQSWDCSNDGSWAMAGTTGQSRRLEAVEFFGLNTGGKTCMQAHVQDIAWQATLCMGDGLIGRVGTVGQARRIEAIRFGSTVLSSCAEAHVAGLGWMGYRCNGPNVLTAVGTINGSRQMEALTGTFL